MRSLSFISIVAALLILLFLYTKYLGTSAQENNPKDTTHIEKAQEAASEVKAAVKEQMKEIDKIGASND